MARPPRTWWPWAAAWWPQWAHWRCGTAVPRSPTTPRLGTVHWQNWSGLESADPRTVISPASVADVVAAVDAARRDRSTVKMVGTGHSFNGIAAPGDVMLRPDRLGGIVAVDREAMTVTAYAGTQLKVLNDELERLGLSLHNMGDIAE